MGIKIKTTTPIEYGHRKFYRDLTLTGTTEEEKQMIESLDEKIQNHIALQVEGFQKMRKLPSGKVRVYYEKVAGLGT